MGAKERLNSLITRALQTSEPVSYESNAEVRLQGEALHKPIYWKGHQWAVTKYGVEARNGQHPIAKDRIWEEEGVYGWIRHLSEKDWVDLSDFAEALRLARKRWPEFSP